MSLEDPELYDATGDRIFASETNIDLMRVRNISWEPYHYDEDLLLAMQTKPRHIMVPVKEVRLYAPVPRVGVTVVDTEPWYGDGAIAALRRILERHGLLNVS